MARPMVGRRVLHLFGDYCRRDSSLEVPQADAIVELNSGRHSSPDPARLVSGTIPIASSLVLTCSAPVCAALAFHWIVSRFHTAQRSEGQHCLQQAALTSVPEEAMASPPPVLNTSCCHPPVTSGQPIPVAVGHKRLSHATPPALVRKPGDAVAALPHVFLGSRVLGTIPSG